MTRRGSPWSGWVTKNVRLDGSNLKREMGREKPGRHFVMCVAFGGWRVSGRVRPPAVEASQACDRSLHRPVRHGCRSGWEEIEGAQRTARRRCVGPVEGLGGSQVGCQGTVVGRPSQGAIEREFSLRAVRLARTAGNVLMQAA